MKILHSADWHLGTKNIKLPPYQQQCMKEERLIAVQNLFENAYSQGYDAILICGDLFHSKSVTQKLANTFFRAVEDFARPVIYVEGNHDENTLVSHQAPKNFYFLNKANPKITINGVNFYADAEGQAIDQNQINVLLLHGNIETPADNDYVNIKTYFQYNFDYIALGHIHQMKKYKKDNQIFAYSGSLFSNGFDEVGDKGFLEVVIEDKRVEKIEFHPFAERRYMVCDCDISACQTSGQIAQNIKKNFNERGISQQDLVRVILKGKYEENSEKSLEYIKKQFERQFYFELKDQSTLKFDLNKIKEEKLSFKYEFISLIENSDLADEDKRKIYEIGLEALKGEDIDI